MSLDGLLSEVKHFHANNLDIALGEQILYGGKRVFSNVTPGSSTCDKAKTDNKKGKGQNNELKGAIANAKNIANKALNEGSAEYVDSLSAIKKDHDNLVKKVEDLTTCLNQIKLELAALRQGQAPAAAPQKEEKASEPAGDDDFDLFGSDDEEDEEKKKVVEERLKAYAEKKAKKPGPIAKSSVILDVKPWDDETNLEEMEKLVRGIEMDGLVWGGGKLIAIGYGIQKLQIICVIEDLKVSVDDLIEKITGDFEDHVQSVDIVAFNKI